MPLAAISFDRIAESDLAEQIATGVPEGVLVDYKKDMYGRSDADVKELLKDVSSFANTSGGHLIIGIEESGGVPVAINPLTGDADQDLQRLESLVRDGMEPRVVGLQMKAIRLGSGGYVLILRIPKSWNPPHRVSARNTNRIFGRNSSGTHEFSVDELRVIFTSAASALDRIRAFRQDRLAKIAAGEAIAPLVQNNGRLVVHVIPIASFGFHGNIDLGKAQKLQQSLRPMGNLPGYSPCINFDGFSNLSHSDTGKCLAYTQIFRNGAIESVKVRVVTDDDQGNLWIPTGDFDRWIFEQVPNYLATLQELDVPPPIVVMITLEGVRGARLAIFPRPIEDLPKIDRDILQLPEVVVEQYGSAESYQPALRPAFDALWNTGGYARSKHFDVNGKWKLPR
jgi:hypothetical protein